VAKTQLKTATSLSRLSGLALFASVGLPSFVSMAYAAPLVLNNLGNVQPTTAGAGQGERALWANAGSVGGSAVDLVAVVTVATLDHTLGTYSGAPGVLSIGPDDIRVEWRLYQSGTYDVATNTGGTLVAADVHIQLNDIDGPANEELHMPVCEGKIDWIRIDRTATTGRAFGTVAGAPDIFSLIGDRNYNQEPISGLEVRYSNTSTFEFGRTANNGFLVRMANPTYSTFDTLDYQCADFAAPTAVDDTGSGATGAAVSVDILVNDAVATQNNNGPNNNSQVASEFGKTRVRLTTPPGATGVVTDAAGDVVGFTVPGQGTWAYNDITGLLTFTPLATFTQNPTPITYTNSNALNITSTPAQVAITYPTPNDGVVTITPTSTPGDSLNITLTDDDLGGAGTATVTVVNPATGESETIVLTETATPGVFSGSVSTQFGTTAGPGGDAELNTQSGNTVRVDYVDALATTGVNITRSAADTVTGGATGVVEITPSIIPGGPLTITLTDADIASNGTQTVTVTNPATGETETITLTETATPGVFTATLPTTFGTAAGPNGDGTLTVEAGDAPLVTYADTFTTTGGPGTATDASTVTGGVTGVVDITPSSTPGQPLTITLTDADLAGTGTATVIVTNPATGETETLTVTETATPGVFTATLPTTFGTSAGPNSNGTLTTQSGNTVQVSYADATTTSGGPGTATDTGTVTGGVTGVVSITPSILPGEPLTITLTDADLVGTGTVTVTLENGETNEVETLILTETTPGVFTATLPTVFGTSAGPNSNGTMSTEAGDTIEVTYADAITSTGAPGAATDIADVTGGATGVVDITPSSTPGQPLTITLTDADLAGNGTQAVTVTNPATGETETLTLTETATPGVFTATLPTVFGAVAGPNSNGTLTTEAGDTVQVSYADTRTSTGAPGTATDTGNVIGGATGVVEITPSIAPGQPLTLTLTDADLAGNGTQTVTVTNPATGETETVTLTETATPGVYTATLPTVYGISAGPNNNGALTVENTNAPLVTYTDARTATGGAGTATDTSSVVGGSDAVITATPDVTPGAPITISVTDADAGANPLVPDRITVQVVNDRTGETETLELIETGPSTGVFTAPMPSAFGNAPGANNSGTLSVIPGDTVTTNYVDALTSTGASTTRTDTTAVTNRPPVAEDDSGATRPGVAISLPLLANDADPDQHPLTVQTVTQGANGVVTLRPDGTVIYLPNPGFTGTDTFTYTISDGNGGTDTATVTIRVDAVSPTAISDSGATEPGTPVTIPVLGNDSDPNQGPLTVRGIISPPMNGTAVVNPDGTITYTPNPGFTGTDRLTYEVCDAQGNCDTAVVLVNVSADNPQARDDTATTPSGQPVTLSPLGNDTDPNGGPLTISSITQPANGTVTLAPDGRVTYTPNPGFSGTDTLTYIVCDAQGNCDVAAITVTVTNRPPIAEPDSVGTPPGVQVSIPITANDSDPENGPLTVQSVTQPTNGTVTFTSAGTVIYTPNPGFTGTDTFDYTVCDAQGLCDTATVSVRVDQVTPTAVSDSGATVPGTPVTLPVLTNDTDPNGDALTVTAVTQPPNGTVVINPNGTLTYTPNPGFTGTDTLTYTACDAAGNCDTAIVTVVVDPLAPQGADDVFKAIPGQPITVSPLTNDRDPNGGPLTVTSVTQPGNGTVVLNPDGTLTYTPRPGFNGVDVVTYVVCDAQGNCDTATVSFDVRSTATISGTVFDDINHDGDLDTGEARRPGVLVEIVDATGAIIATATTDSNGNYVVGGLPPGNYHVVFRDPVTGTALGAIRDIAAVAGGTMVGQDLPIDPSGIIYDVVTGAPIAGVTATLTTRTGTPLPLACFVDASQQNQVTGATGFYQFDVVPGGDALCPVGETQYEIVITLPSGLIGIPGASTVAGPLDATTCAVDAIPGPTCEVSPSVNPPAPGAPATFFTSFLLQAGDPNVVNNHIPVNLAASGTPLTATKRASSAFASTGSVIVYTITVSNPQAVNIVNTDLVDVLPTGFKYVAGTAKIDGVAREPSNLNGRLEWSGVSIPAGGTVVVNLGAVAGAGVRIGDYVNTAFAETALNAAVLSNRAEATVRVQPDEVFDCAEVIGKVFEDKNGDGVQDEGEPGLPGVRLATVKGELVTTDGFGRYHITCAATPTPGIGSNFIVKVDERTLPTGFSVSTENPRVVRLTQGKMSEANFAATTARVVRMDISGDVFREGSTELNAEWQFKIDDAIALLRERPSQLTISYYGGDGAPQRLDAVVAKIREKWGEGPYALKIDTQILTAATKEAK
jgi:Bacterial Ig domain/SdrD B-like domain/Domain of unknown function DUF11